MPDLIPLRDLMPPPFLDTTFDGHIHTSYCHHAIGTMEEYVQAAIKKGLKKIVFLEHMEASCVKYFETTWLTDADFQEYFKEGYRLQEHYKSHLHIGLGVEVGYSTTHWKELRERLQQQHWDQIGISYHFMPVPGALYDLNLVSRKERNIQAIASAGVDTVLQRYFQTLTEAVRNLPGTVLCHLDAALRFQPDLHLTSHHWQQIEQLLSAIKEKKMAIEVNTSGFAIRGTPFPSPQILQMALDLDIPLSVGSDAHRPEDVGRFFDQLPHLLSQLPATI